MNNEIIQLILDKGYFIMFFIMIIEGPMITIIIAFLASQGLFDILVVFSLSILGDFIGDIFFYYIGKYFGLDFIDKFGKYFRISYERFRKINKLLKKHGGKVLFMSKSTTGLGIATFIAAGIVDMDMQKFMKFSILGGIVWSTFLICIGYFFGYLYEEISVYISWSRWSIIIIAIIFIIAFRFFKKNKKNNFGIK